MESFISFYSRWWWSQLWQRDYVKRTIGNSIGRNFKRGWIKGFERCLLCVNHSHFGKWWVAWWVEQNRIQEDGLWLRLLSSAPLNLQLPVNGLNLPKVLSEEERGNQEKVQFLGLPLLSGNATSLRIVIKLSINRLLDVTANLTFQRRQWRREANKDLESFISP